MSPSPVQFRETICGLAVAEVEVGGECPVPDRQFHLRAPTAVEHVLQANRDEVRFDFLVAVVRGGRGRIAAPVLVLILIIIIQESHAARASGNIELVPTSKTPQPQAQANAAPGAKTPANKPMPIFFICEFKFLFFIFKVKSCEHATRRPQVKEIKLRPRLTTLAGKTAWNQAEKLRGGGTGGFGEDESAENSASEKAEMGSGEMSTRFSGDGREFHFQRR